MPATLQDVPGDAQQANADWKQQLGQLRQQVHDQVTKLQGLATPAAPVQVSDGHAEAAPVETEPAASAKLAPLAVEKTTLPSPPRPMLMPGPVLPGMPASALAEAPVPPVAHAAAAPVPMPPGIAEAEELEAGPEVKLLPCPRLSKIGEEDPSRQDRLQVRVVQAEGLPEEAVIAMKWSGCTRQASLASLLSGEPLTLGVVTPGSTALEPLGLTILRPLASAGLALHDSCQLYCLELPTAPGVAPIRLSLCRWGGPAEPPGLPALPAVEEGGPLAVQEFLSKHRLLQYLPSLLQVTVKEQPDQPYDFMVQQLEALRFEEVGHQASDGPAELGLRSAEGVPDGAILSLRVGNERRQAPVKLLMQGLRLRCSGRCVQLSLLLQDASAKLPLHAGQDHYRVRLRRKSGESSALNLLLSGLSRGLPQPPAESYVAEAASEVGVFGSVAASALGVPGQEEYLARHGLVPFTRQLMKELVESLPQDPYAFMAGRLKAQAASRSYNREA